MLNEISVENILLLAATFRCIRRNFLLNNLIEKNTTKKVISGKKYYSVRKEAKLKFMLILSQVIILKIVHVALNETYRLRCKLKVSLLLPDEKFH